MEDIDDWNQGGDETQETTQSQDDFMETDQHQSINYQQEYAEGNDNDENAVHDQTFGGDHSQPDNEANDRLLMKFCPHDSSILYPKVRCAYFILDLICINLVAILCIVLS